MRLQDLKAKQLAASVAAPPPKVSPAPPDPVLEVWNATKDTDSVNVLDAFVGKYPNSFYAELAKARIEELKRRQQVAPLAPVELPSPAPDPALEAWNAIKASESPSVLEAFVDKYPLSLYADLARARIEELKKTQLETAQKAMIRDIQQALKDFDCYGGAVDGVWSGGPREALDRFRRLAKLNPAAPGDPNQAMLDSLKAWKGDHCPAEKVAAPRPLDKAASPRKDKATPVVHEPSLAKPTKAPPARVAKTPQYNNDVTYDSPEKRQAAKKAGRTLEYDYGSSLLRPRLCRWIHKRLGRYGHEPRHEEIESDSARQPQLRTRRRRRRGFSAGCC